MDIQETDDTRLKVGDQCYCRFEVINKMACRRQRTNDERYWQAFYNIAALMNQVGWKHPWPELFYKEIFHEGLAEFNKHFEVIDGYIVPR